MDKLTFYVITDGIIAVIFFTVGYLFYPMYHEHKEYKRKVKSMMKEFEKQEDENEI